MNKKDEKSIEDIFAGVSHDEEEALDDTSDEGLDDLFSDMDIDNEDNTEELPKIDVSKKIFNKKRLQIVKKVTIVSVILFVGIIFFKNRSYNEMVAQENSNQAKTEEIAKSDAIATQEKQKEELQNGMIEKYNAINFNEKSFSFTEDIQNEPNKTFLLEGRVFDIFKDRDDSFVKIDDWYGDIGIFKASGEQIRYMREKTDEYGTIDDLLFIVKVSDSSKSLFETKVDTAVSDSWTYNQPSDGFLLKGILIDVKKSE